MNETKERECPFCKRTFRNLGQHIANSHPNILEKLEEFGNDEIQPRQINTAPIQPIKGGINEMIREKLDTMLNIKIIEMLSNSPDTSIKDIQETLNPKPQTSLQELKEYHDLIYSEKEEKEKNIPYIDTGNQWVDIAQQGLPILKDMLQSRREKQNEIKPRNDGTNKRIDFPTIKPICGEIAGNTNESKSISTEPRSISETKQPNIGESSPIVRINEV